MRRCLLLLVFFALRLDASCGSASCPIDLHALNRPLAGQFTLDLSLQYIDQDRLRGRAFLTEHEELRTVNRSAVLNLGYGLTNALQISAVVPYVSRMHEHIHSGELERWDLHGFGDVMLQARYRFGSDFWAMAGVKLPTGSSTQTNGDERAEVPVQPGSGSTDTIVGLAYEGGVVRATRAEGPLGNQTFIPLFASATYRRNGTAHGYTVGDEWQVNAGTAYPLRSNVEALLQANARVRARDDSPDAEDRELTGGRFVYLSPGVRVSTGKAAWYALLQVPLYQHVNGVQLTAQRNVIAGVQLRF